MIRKTDSYITFMKTFLHFLKAEIVLVAKKIVCGDENALVKQTKDHTMMMLHQHVDVEPCACGPSWQNVVLSTVTGSITKVLLNTLPGVYISIVSIHGQILSTQ